MKDSSQIRSISQTKEHPLKKNRNSLSLSHQSSRSNTFKTCINQNKELQSSNPKSNKPQKPQLSHKLLIKLKTKTKFFTVGLRKTSKHFQIKSFKIKMKAKEPYAELHCILKTSKNFQTNQALLKVKRPHKRKMNS